MNKIINEREALSADTTEIQRIIRDNYEPLFANKLGKLEEMDKLLAA